MIRSHAACVNVRARAKLVNHEAAIALRYMHYNFCRIHKTLRVTPAMEAGLSKHVWTIEELLSILSVEASKPRGPYQKKAAR